MIIHIFVIIWKVEDIHIFISDLLIKLCISFLPNSNSSAHFQKQFLSTPYLPKVDNPAVIEQISA